MRTGKVERLKELMIIALTDAMPRVHRFSSVCSASTIRRSTVR
ncbi:hypothetical protein ACFYO1_17070 [Nocardia sp. NPDC006044]